MNVTYNKMTIADWISNRKKVRIQTRETAQKAQVEAKAREAEKTRLDKQYADAIAKVVIFAGDIAEYERFRGYEPGTVVICDTGSTQQEIFLRMYNDGRVVNKLDTQLRNRLIDDGLEALVHAKPISYSGDAYFARYGLPVKKAK